MRFIDFCSGIGGFRVGMEKAGHICVGHCEIDKFANESYIAMHEPREDEWYADDIRDVKPEELPAADCYCGGFPCQAFSIAGKRGGFSDTRGTIFFEIARLIQARKPKIVFFENVKGLLNHDNGNTFETILRTLGELGYWYEYQVLNSKDFGVPQNRERVFIIGHLGEGSGQQVFPIRRSNPKTLKQVIAGRDAERVYDCNGLARTLKAEGGGQGAKTGLYLFNGTKEGNTYCLDANYAKGDYRPHKAKRSVVAVLTPDRHEKCQNGRRIKEPDEPMFTLTAQDRHGVLIKEATQKGYDIAYEGDSINLAVPGSNTRRGRVGKGIANTLDTSCNQGILVNYRIRRLTPRECFRLQGFLDAYFDKAEKVNSDSQLYKQAGNSVTVNVINEISKRLN